MPSEVMHVNWQSTEIKANLKPLQNVLQTAYPHSPAEQAYLNYYALDFKTAFSGLDIKIGYFDVAGYRLAAQIFRLEQAKGTVLLQHGYYDHVGLYGHIIRHCLAQGFNVFCYDLPGHGLSTGERAAINSFDEYHAVFETGLALCQQYLPGPLVAIGQSTGGAIILDYLLRNRISASVNPFAAVHLLAPLVRPSGWGAAVLIYVLLHKFISRMRRSFTDNSNNPVFLRFISEADPLQPLYLQTNWVGALREWIKQIEQAPACDVPVHVIQGDCDETVDFRHNLPFLQQKFANVKIDMIQGGRHHLANEDETRLGLVTQYLTPLL